MASNPFKSYEGVRESTRTLFSLGREAKTMSFLFRAVQLPGVDVLRWYLGFELRRVIDLRSVGAVAVMYLGVTVNRG